MSNASNCPRSAFDPRVAGGAVCPHLAGTTSMKGFNAHTPQVTARFEPDMPSALGLSTPLPASTPVLTHATGTKRAILSP